MVFFFNLEVTSFQLRNYVPIPVKNLGITLSELIQTQKPKLPLKIVNKQSLVINHNHQSLHHNIS